MKKKGTTTKRAARPARGSSYTQLVSAISSLNTQMVGRVATVANQALVLRNWTIGACIVEFEQNGADRAKYGERLLETLAGDLKSMGLKGLTAAVLRCCRMAYLTYPQIRQTLSERARKQEPQETIADLLRDPCILEFAGLAERPEYSEDQLESALLDHLQRFLLELGRGFCFEARQFRMTEGRKHHRVDLVPSWSATARKSNLSCRRKTN